jgi:hypothetical protein
MDITNINSKNALLTFSREDLAEHDLVRWIKSNTSNFGRKYFIDESPFEKCAAKLYNEKNPSKQVKYGKSFRNEDGTVSVFLAVTEGMSKDYIKNQHPDKLVFSHQPKFKAGEPTATDSVVRRKASYKEEGEVYFKVASLDNVEDMTDNKIFSTLLKQAEANDFDMTFSSNIPISKDTNLMEFSSGDIRMVVACDGKSAELYSIAADFSENDPLEEEKEIQTTGGTEDSFIPAPAEEVATPIEPTSEGTIPVVPGEKEKLV